MVTKMTSRHSTTMTMRALADLGICPQPYIQYEDFEDRVKYGFPKRKIIYDMKCLLHAVEYAIGRENKINVAREIFAYLATTGGKKFIQTYNDFEKAVKQKLMELRYKESLREAQRWWRDIFGTRIPIEP